MSHYSTSAVNENLDQYLAILIHIQELPVSNSDPETESTD